MAAILHSQSNLALVKVEDRSQILASIVQGTNHLSNVFNEFHLKPLNRHSRHGSFLREDPFIMIGECSGSDP